LLQADVALLVYFVLRINLHVLGLQHRIQDTICCKQ